MNIARKYISLLVVALIMSGFLIACGDGGGSNTSTNTRETVTVKGSVADSMASLQSGSKNTLLAKAKDFFAFVKNAFAQEQQVYEGIQVEAFDGDTKVGEDTTDASGEFVIENVPCDTPLTLVFTFEGNEVVLDGVSVPCLGMTDEGIISMVVSLNFQDGEGEVDEIENENDLLGAAFNCSTGEENIDMNGEEYMLDGEGKACIVTDGNCNLKITASNVLLTNCSTCIDTRGNSSVEIDSTQFDCVSNHDGIRSVGNSMVDITVVSSNMMDDTVVGSGNGDIFIISGDDGADLRGTAKLDMAALADDTIMSTDNSDITIQGVSNSIKAVGNSDASIESDTCSLTPDTTTLGNASIELNCQETQE